MSRLTAPSASPRDIVRRARGGCAALALGVLAACDATSGPGARPPISLSFAARPSSNVVIEPTWLGSRHTFDLQTADGDDVLVVSSVELVLDEIELERSGAGDACASGEYSGEGQIASSSGSSDDCMEIESGPHLVDLPLGDGAAPVAAVEVGIPAGSYSQLELKLRPLDPSSGEDRRFLAAHPDFDGVNLRVRGTFDGEAFEFTTALDDEIELYFLPALEVGEGGVNITVNLDVLSWFRNADGTLIDPRTAAAGQPSASVVGANLWRSLAVFEDDDHDGYDDHGRHGRDG